MFASSDVGACAVPHSISLRLSSPIPRWSAAADTESSASTRSFANAFLSGRALLVRCTMGLPNVIGYSSLAGDLRASPHQLTRERLEALSKAECSTSMTVANRGDLSLRLQLLRTAIGVLLVFFANTSRMMIAWWS